MRAFLQKDKGEKLNGQVLQGHHIGELPTAQTELLLFSKSNPTIVSGALDHTLHKKTLHSVLVVHFAF